MIEVIVEDQEDFDRYLKKFKKLVNQDGRLQETKDRRYFMKPSEKKRIEKQRRIREKGKR